MGVVSWRELDRYFADAYCKAALAGAEMRAASNTIETLRDAVLAIPAGKSVMEAWAAFDEQIGLADLNQLVPVLVNLRQEFIKIATEREIYRLLRASEREPEAGWVNWVETYARALSPWGWRTTFGNDIARDGLKGRTLFKDWPIKRIRDATELVKKSRWSETYDWFIFLAEEDIQPELRAHLLSIAAEIQLYHFYQPSKTKELLELADRLAPDFWRLQIVWGEYWMHKEDLERARSCFEQVIQQMPDISDGYINLGDYYDKKAEYTRAEDLYQQAIINAPGAIDGYRRLANFYGNSTRIKEREDRLAPLFKRILALEEDRSYSYVAMGIIYKENRRFDDALRYFEEAIQEDPGSALAHIWKGYTYLDQISDPQQDSVLLEKARTSFDKVIELAPHTIDGFWGTMRLEMQIGHWDAALEACNRCFGIHPEWESFVLVGRADIYRGLGRLEQAESDLLKSLEIEPDNPGAISVLTSLAEGYQSVEDKAISLRALETVRRYKGDSYEQTYQNLIGNMHYYFGEYAEAAQCYRMAVSAKPDDDVFHSNLALALERIKTPGNRLAELEEAIQHLQEALAINSCEAEYHTRLRALESEYQFIITYGEAARQYTPVVPGIRIRVSDNLLAEILNTDQSDLSDETRLVIDAMRKHIRETLGVELPGVLFSYMDKTYSQSGRYEIYFQEKLQDFGYAEPGKIFAQVTDESTEPENQNATPCGQWLNDPGEVEEHERDRYTGFFSVTKYILNHTRRAVAANPLELFGFQDMANLLSSCDEESVKQIRKSHQEMLRYTLVLKKLIGRQISLKDIQNVSREYLSIRQETDEVGVIADRLAAKTSAAD